MGPLSDTRDAAPNFAPCFYFSFLTENSAKKKVMRIWNKIKLTELHWVRVFTIQDICYEL